MTEEKRRKRIDYLKYWPLVYKAHYSKLGDIQRFVKRCPILFYFPGPREESAIGELLLDASFKDRLIIRPLEEVLQVATEEKAVRIKEGSIFSGYPIENPSKPPFRFLDVDYLGSAEDHTEFLIRNFKPFKFIDICFKPRDKEF